MSDWPDYYLYVKGDKPDLLDFASALLRVDGDLAKLYPPPPDLSYEEKVDWCKKNWDFWLEDKDSQALYRESDIGFTCDCIGSTPEELVKSFGEKWCAYATGKYYYVNYSGFIKILSSAFPRVTFLYSASIPAGGYYRILRTTFQDGEMTTVECFSCFSGVFVDVPRCAVFYDDVLTADDSAKACCFWKAPCMKEATEEAIEAIEALAEGRTEEIVMKGIVWRAKKPGFPVCWYIMEHDLDLEDEEWGRLWDVRGKYHDDFLEWRI